MNLSALFDAHIQPPERLTRIESWHRHIPFACAIVHMLKPAVLVELGTHRGDSYSAFCQAVVQQKLPTRCYAVDTWQGDAHAGEYGDEVYDDLRQWHDVRYSEFSSLLRMTFDQALEHFVDGSVDLLHIDGLHTYDAVKHDFDSWLPKLSDRAVVLFHDTNVRYDDFAVWQLWAELAQRYPAFEFPYGFGLGVLAVGRNVPAEVLEFLRFANAHPQTVINYFHRQGDASEVRKKQEEIQRLQLSLDSLGQQLEYARKIVVERDGSIQAYQQQQQQLKHSLQGAGQQIARLELSATDLSRKQNELLRVQANLRRLLSGQEYQLRMVLGSRLWQLRNRAMSVLGMGHRRVDFEPLDLLPMSEEQLQQLQQNRPGVTIIVPVYGGLEETVACIEAVLASTYLLDMELVVINDASPEPELVQWLNANAERFTLLHNEHNLGFVGTVNRGMRLYPDRDVVLVNSDTLVANDWLDRMQATAYASGDIGSVTPFSNNATICSFPLFCQDNPLPEGQTVAATDALFATANAGQSVDIPTAVGFCMYIRRDCLQQAGLFDELNFGRGYGEENEFCMRSALQGWRHVLAGDVFVFHRGGVSFAETQSDNQKRGHAALTRLFPDYDWVVQQHIAADPAARLRFAAEMALVRDSGLPVVLMVSHGRGGGSQQHVGELAKALQGQAHVYVLQPCGNMLGLRNMADAGQRAGLYFAPEADFDLLQDTLRHLGVAHVHFHHLIDVPEAVLRLPELLQCRYDVTVHDYFLACPQVTMTDAQGRYCGAPDDAGCNACMQARPVSGVADIRQWREQHAVLLAGAERVFVPSVDTLGRISSYFGNVTRWVVARHEPALEQQALKLAAISDSQPMRVLVLGALSAFKGADVLEGVALQARSQGLPLEFHLLGYGYRELRSWPVSALHVHGAYEQQELARRIDELQPHVVWFPGDCPETWSYTLSAALQSGMPVIASEIGAFVERLAGREWSWLVPVNSTVEAWLQSLLEVRSALLSGQKTALPAMHQQAAAGFVYATDYLPALQEQAPAMQQNTSLASTQGHAERDAEGFWRHLHARWQQLSNQPRTELLSQVGNRHVRRLLVYTLRNGWLQPVLARMPHGLQATLKRWLVR